MNPPAAADEIEIKLAASTPEVLRRIAQLRSLGAYRLAPQRTAHLRTTYLDTPDRALTRAGMALRLRRSGRRWEASIKWSGHVQGALHARPELTVPLSTPPGSPFQPPDALRAPLASVVLGRPLAPILVSDVRRTLRNLQKSAAPPTSAPLAEVALDSVCLRTPDGAPLVPPYHEIEIEQRSATTKELKSFSRLLRDRFGLVPSADSKLARGLAALAGSDPFGGAAPEMHADDPTAVALRAMVARELPRLRRADAGTRRGDPDALHQERVSIRRLRAALRAFADAVPARPRERLNTELRWLSTELGRVRDVDVQLTNLVWHAKRAGGDARPHVQSFRRVLLRERRARRAALAAALDSVRYRRLLLALERFAASAPPRRLPAAGAVPIAGAARSAIKRAFRRLLRRGDTIGDMPRADDLHALRIRAKRLRYLLDAVMPLAGRRGRKLMAALADLQDVLGRFHDSIVASALLREHVKRLGRPSDVDVERTLADMSDTELRRAGAAQAEFARAWRRFAGKATQRQRRELLKTLRNRGQRHGRDRGTSGHRRAERAQPALAGEPG
jgi:triphosphatase